MTTSPEKRRITTRKHYLKNRGKILRKRREYLNAHPGLRREQKHRWKKRHPDVFKRQWINDANRRNEFLWGIKHNPCTDCGRIYPAPAMDFDHINSRSHYNVAASLGAKRLIKEVAKCQLVCANCHRIRTWKRQNGYSLSIRTSDLFC